MNRWSGRGCFWMYNVRGLQYFSGFIIVKTRLLRHSGIPLGANCRRDTVDSDPSFLRIWAYCGLASSNSTSSTGSSYLLVLTFLLASTGPGVNQDGKETPLVERRGWLKNRSWGVEFVAVQSRERIAWRDSCRTLSQSSVCNP